MNEEKKETVSSENTEEVKPETEETAEKLDKKDKKAVKLLEKQLEDSKKEYEKLQFSKACAKGKRRSLCRRHGRSGRKTASGA